MGYHPRIEASDISSLCTIRNRNSELWFVNNKRLEEAILANIAKCQKRYEVVLYAAAIEGNHLHDLTLYPHCNRAAFKRDLHSAVAKAVAREVPSYPGGRLFARRYSAEYIADAATIEEYFFYIVLQPVQDGLVERISDYPGYNCFSDAVSGAVRKFEVVNWTAYNNRKRWDRNCRIRDYTETVELKYQRLPGYEHLSQREYKKLMQEKLEQRRVKIVEERRAKGLGFMGREKLLAQAPGGRPRRTKTSTIKSHRPRVLAVDNDARASARNWYFEFYFDYKRCSKEYRSGNLEVEFPPGSYKPPLFTCATEVMQLIAG